MSNHSEAFVAFDSSKLRNAVAIADSGRTGEIRFLGEIENSTAATAKLVRKLAGKYERLTFCYEAGPTGYELYRQIKSLGHASKCVRPGRGRPTGLATAAPLSRRNEMPVRDAKGR
jgi:hypothetical protein